MTHQDDTMEHENTMPWTHSDFSMAAFRRALSSASRIAPILATKDDSHAISLMIRMPDITWVARPFLILQL